MATPRRSLSVRTILTVLAGLASVYTSTAQTYVANPISIPQYAMAPYAFTGLIFTDIGTSGSGAVVKHPKIVISCAHVIFNKNNRANPWSANNRWYLASSRGSGPSTSGQILRGYFVFKGYSSAASVQINSPTSFSQDFVAYFAFEDTAGGGAAGWWPNGLSVLRGSAPKLITGYPQGLYSYQRLLIIRL